MALVYNDAESGLLSEDTLTKIGLALLCAEHIDYNFGTNRKKRVHRVQKPLSEPWLYPSVLRESLPKVT